MERIRTKKAWLKHMPKHPHRLERAYYSQADHKYRQRITRIVLFILIIFLSQGIFQTKYLKLDNLVISGYQDLSLEDIQIVANEQLQTKRLLFFRNNNYFLIKTDKLEGALVAKYNLDGAEVKKKFPHTLEIKVQEKISHFIWQANDSLYLLDAKGFLNRQIEALDEKYLVIEDQRSQKPVSGQVFNEIEINVINEIYLDWNRIIGAKPVLKRIVMTDDSSLIQLYTEPGFSVKLNPQEDINQQLVNLQKVLAAQNITGGDIDYIDIRFENRVYFK
jgi:cell division septal protein FtsQ